MQAYSCASARPEWWEHSARRGTQIRFFETFSELRRSINSLTLSVDLVRNETRRAWGLRFVASLLTTLNTSNDIFGTSSHKFVIMLYDTVVCKRRARHLPRSFGA
jgi:hypothetical protein